MFGPRMNNRPVRNCGSWKVQAESMKETPQIPASSTVTQGAGWGAWPVWAFSSLEGEAWATLSQSIYLMRLALHRHLALEDMSTTMSTVGPGPESGKGPSKEAAIHLSNLRRRKWSPFLSTLNRTSFRRSPARVCRTILLLVNFVLTPTWHGEQDLWHLSLLH